MKRRVMFLSLLAIFFGTLCGTPVKAEETSGSHSSLQTLDEKISRKLEKIEKKQDEILSRLEEMKTELNIVKIRASLKS